jgi:hypothetical protein
LIDAPPGSKAAAHAEGVGNGKRPPEGGHNLSPSPSHVARMRDARFATLLQAEALSRGAEINITTKLTPSRHDPDHKFHVL